MLQVRGLRVSYGRREALRAIDLDVARGEVVGLIGPNGCGKTSLLKAVTAATAAEGRVVLDGMPVQGMSVRDLARRVAVVPQNPRLPAGYTARDVVLMGRTAHLGFLDQESGEDRRLAEDALMTLGAGDLADREVDEMSGGERQNVVIARALVQQAPLFLLDEPTANLDIGHQIAIARLLRSLATTESKAILVAIHDLTLASLYCDRLLLLGAGRVLAAGAPAAVLNAKNLRDAYGVEGVLLQVEGGRGPAVLPISPTDPS